MFGRVTVHASDGEASAAFYRTQLAVLGIEADADLVDGPRWRDFALACGSGRVTRGLHLGFVAPSRDHVDSFWRAGIEAGYREDGEPGPRPRYRHDYYGAFLLDPDGNSVEAVHHGDMREGGAIDHLWIRVREIEAAKRFYESSIAPRAALRLGADTRERATLLGGSGSFSLVPGRPSENVQMSFAAADGRPGETLIDPDGNVVEIVGR